MEIVITSAMLEQQREDFSNAFQRYPSDRYPNYYAPDYNFYYSHESSDQFFLWDNRYFDGVYWSCFLTRNINKALYLDTPSNRRYYWTARDINALAKRRT